MGPTRGTIPSKALRNWTRLWIYQGLNMHTGLSAGLWHGTLNWIFPAGKAQWQSWTALCLYWTPASSSAQVCRILASLGSECGIWGANLVRKLRFLIWNIMMKPNTVGYSFFPGWLKWYSQGQDDEEKELRCSASPCAPVLTVSLPIERSYQKLPQHLVFL